MKINIEEYTPGLGGAIVSPCGKFRYRLWRQWDTKRKYLVWVMLNPSTADAHQDDPTIRRCIGFAQRLRYGGIQVVNLFAFRATSPRDLQSHGYPKGPRNEEYVEEALRLGDRTAICAWGNNAARMNYETSVMLDLIRKAGCTPMALHTCKDGRTPAHPLMLPYTCMPFPIT